MMDELDELMREYGVEGSNFGDNNNTNVNFDYTRTLSKDAANYVNDASIYIPGILNINL